MPELKLVDSLDGVQRLGIWGYGREGKAAQQLATAAGVAEVVIFDDGPAGKATTTDPADSSNTRPTSSPDDRPAGAASPPDGSGAVLATLDGSGTPDGSGSVSASVADVNQGLGVSQDLVAGPVVRFADDMAELAQCDLVVRSPGACIYDERYQQLKTQVKTSSITDFWMQAYGRQTIAVTGTKGKSTTAVLLKAVLAACGIVAEVGGNLGFPLTELDRQAAETDASETSWYVAEVSSFQAAELKHFPRYGIFTSFYPEHLNWHQTLDNYRADKTNLFSDPETEVVAAAKYNTAEVLNQQAIAFDESRYSAAGAEGLVVFKDERKIVDLAGCYLGTEVSLSAVVLTLEIVERIVGDLAPFMAEIVLALTRFEGLEHRRQTVYEANGIEAIDDTLATNPEATASTLSQFANRRVALIVGGKDRGLDFSALVNYLLKRTAPTLAICVPDTGTTIAEDLERGEAKAAMEVVRADNIEQATSLGFEFLKKPNESTKPDHLPGQSTEAGGALVLSPASPSFNQYVSYEELSERFVESCQKT